MTTVPVLHQMNYRVKKLNNKETVPVTGRLELLTTNGVVLIQATQVNIAAVRYLSNDLYWLGNIVNVLKRRSVCNI